jgi:hypothetical protein
LNELIGRLNQSSATEKPAQAEKLALLDRFSRLIRKQDSIRSRSFLSGRNNWFLRIIRGKPWEMAVECRFLRIWHGLLARVPLG